MSRLEKEAGDLQRGRGEEAFEKYRRPAVAREDYLLRRQRKEILEKCRRVAIVGAGTDPNCASHIRTEKLLGLGLEVIPVLPRCESYLGVPCYSSLRAIPGHVDIVQVYPCESVDLLKIARETVATGAQAFWIEEDVASPEVKAILAEGRVQLMEHESLERGYVKHFPFPERMPIREGKRSHRVAERMTEHPITVKPTEGIKEAIEKMKTGHFRHLPVVDDEGKLVGMLSDRDIRLIRPSLAFVSPDEAEIQLWSTAVRRATVFDPVTVYPDAPLEQAAELMLRWEVGGLPVVDEKGNLSGIITYTDLLREFVAREK